jgi:hypothetical protein
MCGCGEALIIHAEGVRRQEHDRAIRWPPEGDCAPVEFPAHYTLQPGTDTVVQFH